MRNGQIRSDTTTMTIVVKTTRNDDSSAKPAPGPMYASAAAGAPNTRPSPIKQAGVRSLVV